MTEYKKFGYYDTRIGNHSYSDWRAGFWYCDGKTHVSRHYRSKPCDGSCTEGKIVEFINLPKDVQKEFSGNMAV